jgi:hypothetical protein
LARPFGKSHLVGSPRRCDDDLPPQPVLVIDQTARQGHGDFGNRGQRRQCAIPSAQQQRAHRARIGAGVSDAHDHRYAAIRLIEFSRHAAVIGRVDRLQYVRRLETVDGE